jgi:hypothetical protein
MSKKSSSSEDGDWVDKSGLNSGFITSLSSSSFSALDKVASTKSSSEWKE